MLKACYEWDQPLKTTANSSLKIKPLFCFVFLPTLLSFSPSLCGMSVLSDWNPAFMLCIRRRSLLLAISLRIRLSWSRAVSGVRGMFARLEGNAYGENGTQWDIRKVIFSNNLNVEFKTHKMSGLFLLHLNLAITHKVPNLTRLLTGKQHQATLRSVDYPCFCNEN